jgi:hypothetical protein
MLKSPFADYGRPVFSAPKYSAWMESLFRL